MELNLSEPERTLLEEILEARYSSLQREIAHTDHREFRQRLRDNEKLIEAVLNRLRVSSVAKAS